MEGKNGAKPYFWECSSVPEVRNQAGLEINQGAVARLALGAHGKTTNEAVEGAMGWESFEAQEAKSKILYKVHLRNL